MNPTTDRYVAWPVQLNIDSASDLSVEYGVFHVPSLLYFPRGRAGTFETWDGAIALPDLRRTLEQVRLYVRICERACVSCSTRACVRVRACVRACVRVSACGTHTDAPGRFTPSGTAGRSAGAGQAQPRAPRSAPQQRRAQRCATCFPRALRPEVLLLSALCRHRWGPVRAPARACQWAR
jgi:hypothetical protein